MSPALVLDGSSSHPDPRRGLNCLVHCPQSGQLNEYTERKEMSADVVCMSLANVPPGEQRSRFLAVGLADNTVRIISLDPSVRAEDAVAGARGRGTLGGGTSGGVWLFVTHRAVDDHRKPPCPEVIHTVGVGALLVPPPQL